MERLKLINVLTSTFLGSKFHAFTIRSLKMLFLPERHRVFFTQLIFMTSSRRSHNVLTNKIVVICKLINLLRLNSLLNRPKLPGQAYDKFIMNSVTVRQYLNTIWKKHQMTFEVLTYTRIMLRIKWNADKWCWITKLLFCQDYVGPR